MGFDWGAGIDVWVLGKESQDLQDQVLSTEWIYLPQPDGGQGIRDKDKERGDEEEGKRKQGEGRGIFSLDKGLHLDREETDMAHRKGSL